MLPQTMKIVMIVLHTVSISTDCPPHCSLYVVKQDWKSNQLSPHDERCRKLSWTPEYEFRAAHLESLSDCDSMLLKAVMASRRFVNLSNLCNQFCVCTQCQTIYVVHVASSAFGSKLPVDQDQHCSAPRHYECTRRMDGAMSQEMERSFQEGPI